MFYYKITCENTGEKKEIDQTREIRARNRKFAYRSEEFNFRLNGETYFFTVEGIDGDAVTVGAICMNDVIEPGLISSYFSAVGLKVAGVRTEEVTFGELQNMLRLADGNNYIESDNDVLEKFGLEPLLPWNSRSLSFDDAIIEKRERDEIYSSAEASLASSGFIEELDRIYAGKKVRKAKGHPVHYFVRTNTPDTNRQICRMLLSALYANGRTESRRYSCVDIISKDRISYESYEALYKSAAGGTVIVRYMPGDDIENDHASADREKIEFLTDIMKKYRNEVLTVFCFPFFAENIKDIFTEYLYGTVFIDLCEEAVSGEKAERFLKALAKDVGVRTDKRLFERLDGNEGYFGNELTDMFNEWYNIKLKTGIYPQYNGIETIACELSDGRSRGSAYEELMGMVGLDEAKKVIRRAINFQKSRILYALKGRYVGRTSMHMVFTGNPGTAKTSVARLFSRIMKENGFIEKDKIIEVGRGDLVGKYVGWTAPTIQRKFREAKGGVLFIDEAYSLVDDRDGSYGDEAINTIVQEMENHRDDVIVIFAGYPDKMEQFLDKNPGLRSRIAFHVPFDDYDTDDLCDIAEVIAKENGLIISDDASGKLRTVFEAARHEKDFGNGRYVRNVLEKARMALGERLLAMDFETLTPKDMQTIHAEDIDMPPRTVNTHTNRIGFSA